MPTTVSCPYCNAPVPVVAGDRRVSCPRCEETVTVHDGETRTPSTPDPVTIAPSPAPPRRSNRSVAGLVVALMLGMAAVGLTFALRTVETRRANDSKGVQEPDVIADARPAPPGEWSGLGYLPEDVQAIGGIRVATALESPAGRNLLAAFGVDDVAQTRWLGLPPADVDQLVAGASFRALPPRVTAVVQTRAPVSDRQLRAALGSDRTVEQRGKSLLRGRLWAKGPEGSVWRPDRFVLVAALLSEDFDHVPATPRVGAARFASPLPEMLRERVDPAAVAWLVAAVDDGSPALGLAASLLPLPPADREAVGKLEALAVSVRADDTAVTLTVHVRGRDGAGEAVGKAIADSLAKVGVQSERRADGTWQRLTATADAVKLAEWLRGR